jgi:hypothetical protein
MQQHSQSGSYSQHSSYSNAATQQPDEQRKHSSLASTSKHWQHSGNLATQPATTAWRHSNTATGNDVQQHSNMLRMRARYIMAVMAFESPLF